MRRQAFSCWKMFVLQLKTYPNQRRARRTRTTLTRERIQSSGFWILGPFVCVCVYLCTVFAYGRTNRWRRRIFLLYPHSESCENNGKVFFPKFHFEAWFLQIRIKVNSHKRNPFKTFFCILLYLNPLRARIFCDSFSLLSYAWTVLLILEWTNRTNFPKKKYKRISQQNPWFWYKKTLKNFA